MTRRLTLLRAAGLAVLATLAAPAQADGETRYTGLALTYYFGGNGGSLPKAPDLSLGPIQHTVDFQQAVSVVQLPLVQVPLSRAGQPILAPIAAMVDAAHWVGERAWRVPAKLQACLTRTCDSLPDLGAR